MVRTVLTAFVFSGLPLIAGCGATSAEAPATVPAKGTVTFKGKTLTQGTVTFEPEGAGKEANGDIQPDGSFELTTYKKGDGAVLGSHRVAVSGAGKLVPLKFTNVSSSKMTIEVTEGKTDYPIDLK